MLSGKSVLSCYPSSQFCRTIVNWRSSSAAKLIYFAALTAASRLDVKKGLYDNYDDTFKNIIKISDVR